MVVFSLVYIIIICVMPCSYYGVLSQGVGKVSFVVMSLRSRPVLDSVLVRNIIAFRVLIIGVTNCECPFVSLAVFFSAFAFSFMVAVLLVAFVSCVSVLCFVPSCLRSFAIRRFRCVLLFVFSVNRLFLTL